MTIPVTCQILKIPLVWVIQSTWLEDFFAHGAGMTDNFKFLPFKKFADWMVLLFINFWIRYGFLNPVNQAAKHYGVKGYKSIFAYWRGEVTLVAEPAEFTGVKLPRGYFYTGPLIAHQNFPIPAGVLVTGWLPAHQVNQPADLSLIHGGIGTVMTAAYAGKPVVGVGMQPEQVANLAALVRKGFAIRVPKSRDPSKKVQQAIRLLLHDSQARQKAEAFSKVMEQWDGPKMAADLLNKKFGG